MHNNYIIVNFCTFHNECFAGKANRPFNVSAHKQNKESMEVKWKPPFFSGGVPIDYYDATVSPPPHDGTCSSGNCSVPGTSITINGLECSSYNITIQARNCVGQGSPLQFVNYFRYVHHHE